MPSPWWLLAQYGVALGSVVLLSRLVCVVATPRSHWFALHAVANAVICVLCAPTLLEFGTPDFVFAPATSSDASLAVPWDAAWVAALHVYHLVGYARVSREDWLHHVLFVPYSQYLVLLPQWCGWTLRWGGVLQLQHFFVCGLPGMVDYACLALRRDKRLATSVQKRIQVKLNMWLRVPGILASCTLLAHDAVRRGVPLEMQLAVASNVLLIGGNALYYAERVVRASPPDDLPASSARI